MSRGRRSLIYSLVGITTLLTVVGVFSVWANRLLFSPDNWSSTSTQLLQNENVRATTANYLVDQLYANVNVAGVLRDGLPTQLQPLAGPASGALRNVAVQGAELALTRPRVQQLWGLANRAADQALVTIVKGGTRRVSVQGGAVTLNLGVILSDIAARLGLPSSLAAKLPPSVAHLTVLRSNQLKAVQNGGNAIQGLALWLTILCPVLFALAIAITPRGWRHRTLFLDGAALILAGILVLLGRSILKSQVAGALTQDASLRVTIQDVMQIATGILGEIAGAVILVGAVIALAGWFGGRSRPARAGRRAVAPLLREHPVEAYAITVAVMVLVFIWDPIPATGKVAGIIVFLALALFGTFVLSRQTAAEFPDVASGEVTARMGAALRRSPTAPRRSGRAAPITGGATDDGTLSDQLRSLADLRGSGDLSDAEYQAAKERLLKR